MHQVVPRMIRPGPCLRPVLTSCAGWSTMEVKDGSSPGCGPGCELWKRRCCNCCGLLRAAHCGQRHCGRRNVDLERLRRPEPAGCRNWRSTSDGAFIAGGLVGLWVVAEKVGRAAAWCFPSRDLHGVGLNVFSVETSWVWSLLCSSINNNSAELHRAS